MEEKKEVVSRRLMVKCHNDDISYTANTIAAVLQWLPHKIEDGVFTAKHVHEAWTNPESANEWSVFMEEAGYMIVPDLTYDEGYISFVHVALTASYIVTCFRDTDTNNATFEVMIAAHNAQRTIDQIKRLFDSSISELESKIKKIKEERRNENQAQ